jgi:hypothetical protein
MLKLNVFPHTTGHWVAIPLLFVLALGGCSQGDQPDLGLVTGRILLNGEALPHVEVAFQPDNGRPSYGQADDDGHYELTYIRDTKGAKIGKHRVLVRSGSVDSDAIEPVEVYAGKNVIDINCKRSTKQSRAPAKNN